VGWSESKVKQYSALLSSIVTDVLILAKAHQAGRVTEKVTPVTFNFTEYWFRSSGLYDINKEHQEKLMRGPRSPLDVSNAQNIVTVDINEVNDNNNPAQDRFMPEETPQSKVKESTIKTYARLQMRSPSVR